MLERLYSWLLRAYPREFREEYEAAMRQAFRDQLRDAVARRRVARFCLGVLADWSTSAAHVRTAASFALTLVGATVLNHYLWMNLGALLHRAVIGLPWPYSFGAEIGKETVPDALSATLALAFFLACAGKLDRARMARGLILSIPICVAEQLLLNVVICTMPQLINPVAVTFRLLLLSALIAGMLASLRNPKAGAPRRPLPSRRFRKYANSPLVRSVRPR